MAGEVVRWTPVNAVHAHVETSPGVRAEIKDRFTYLMENARYHPLVKKGHWDGTISLFKKNMLYLGLRDDLKLLCEQRGYEFEYDAGDVEEYSDADLESYVETLDIPDHLTIRDYQTDAFRHGVHNHRALFLSPTSSGKSLMIYQLIRWHGLKTLIIVPTVTLVHQMAGDFKEYGFDENDIHKIAGGERWTDKSVTITTWQSAVSQEKEWFDQFGVVFGDEAHRFAAKSLIHIMESLDDCHIRYGFTGSLDESKCNKMTLIGLFGPVKEVISTRELIDAGWASELAIHAIMLKHPEPIRKMKMKYQEELQYLYGCESRNRFLADLTLNLEGNTLLLYHRIEHGKLLYDMLKKQTSRNVFLVHGGVDGEIRNDIRAQIEGMDDGIIVASVGTFSTGINIKRLHNIIAGSSWKSRVLNLQSIGRGLRLGEGKDKCNFYDIMDDMSHKKRKNYTLLHSEARITLYCQQEFDYIMHKVDL
jgi:superfamily II DNA or RNA helicase